ncbi:MAG TPA: dihydrofolate reductase family protein [Candidatus Dormibacteraeota bacterium]|jgi:dihydrofolate reductase|nr:dihydrofolate reductase family protein [Candidatus Dormibacteraeota bacterium]HEX2681642.1 dihydrofolate reductase family protein [Candidatus Dormibacteraeota bacterium]
MRKIVAALLMSLDGVVEGTDRWGWPRYMNAEMTQGIVAGVAQADAVLLGRRTYEQFLKIWPGRGSDVPMADFLNKSPKYVVSSTLRDPLEWSNSRVIAGDLTEELNRLKSLPGKNIQLPGSPTLIRSLLRDGLLDELTISVCPVVVGQGMRLFDGIGKEVSLRLVRSVPLSNGVIGVTYAPAQANGGASVADFPTAASAR